MMAVLESEQPRRLVSSSRTLANVSVATPRVFGELDQVIA